MVGVHFLTFRVPLLNFFSSKMLFVIWCVFGGFLLHFFGSLFLESLLKPNYEKPVDTAQDVLDRGLTIIKSPGSESKVERLRNSSSAVTRELAERIIVPKVILFFSPAFLFNLIFLKGLV